MTGERAEGASGVGQRVLVTGLAGAGKSTFSRMLSERTGLPVVTLDVHFWRPGWTEPPEEEWREQVRVLLAGPRWIADGNDRATLEDRLARADTVVLLDLPWWVCVRRALLRGFRRRPPGFQLPAGCAEPAWRRLYDEWRLAFRLCRVHGRERDRELELLRRNQDRVTLHVLGSRRAVADFLGSEPGGP